MLKKSYKNVLVFVIALLFLTITFSSTITAESNKENLMTIWMPGITDDNYKTQKTIPQLESQTFYNQLNNSLTLIENAMSLTSPGSITITTEEWNEIKTSVNNLVSFIKTLDENFPELDTQKFISDIVASLLNPSDKFLKPIPVFSVGRGFTWIPFYDYESFQGTMLRPIFTQYQFGFTTLLDLTLLPPSFAKHIMLGTHRMISIGFSGIFINFGDIGIDRALGPMIFIGLAYVRI